MNPLPDISMTDEEIALWILQGGHGDWLELDLQVDCDAIYEEYHKVNHMFVPHRDGSGEGEGTHKGWEACTLHGIEYDKTNVWNAYGFDTEPEYKWTQAGKKCNIVQTLFESMPAEKLSRVRFMKLNAGGYITPHTDGGSGINWDKIFDHPLPVNIAIHHPKDCHMHITDVGTVPFNNGKAFLVNILKEHSVVNNSNSDRIHIIGHLLVGNKKAEYCAWLANSYRRQYVLQGQI